MRKWFKEWYIEILLVIVLAMYGAALQYKMNQAYTALNLLQDQITVLSDNQAVIFQTWDEMRTTQLTILELYGTQEVK